MAHQFFLHRDRGTHFIQPSAIAVAKRMPADGAKPARIEAGLSLSRWAELLFNGFLPSRTGLAKT